MQEKPEWQEETAEITIGFIRGRIVDESGNPLEGVRITTNDSATYSDSTGVFIIGDRPCLNPHHLMAYLEGLAVETRKLELAEGTKLEVELRMVRIPVCISGVVKDPSGNPLPGVLLCLGSPLKPCVYSAADGSYLLCDAPPGYYTLTATKDGYVWPSSGMLVKIPSSKTFKMKKA
jgi:hypothetical protein